MNLQIYKFTGYNTKLCDATILKMLGLMAEVVKNIENVSLMNNKIWMQQ